MTDTTTDTTTTPPEFAALSSSQLEAYRTAKRSVGWRRYPLDVARIGGKDAADLLQRLTTNNTLGLKGGSEAGEGVCNIFVTDKARIIDVFTTLAEADGALLALFSEGFASKAIEWLDKYTFVEDVSAKDASAEFAPFLIFGPRARQFCEDLTGADLRDLRAHAWTKVRFANGVECALVKHLPLAEYCFIALAPAGDEERLRDLFGSLGEAAEIDENVFEVLRVEAAWGKHGAEWTAERNPLEAGLVSFVDFKKGCYIGQEVIARLDTYNKVKVRLCGFTGVEPIAAGARFVDDSASDKPPADIGGVTSAVYSPELERHIALGYIRSAFANPGLSVKAIAGAPQDGAAATAQELEIVKLPFTM
jgi:folate-binding protein YgfZ